MTASKEKRRPRSSGGLACLSLLTVLGCGDEGTSSGDEGSGGASATGGAAAGTGGALPSSGGNISSGGSGVTGGAPGAGGLGSGGASGSSGGSGAGGALTLPPGPCTDSPEGVEMIELGRAAPSSAGLGVVAYRVVYPSADGTRVQGQICVPDAPGPHPILVHNRGGVAGLSVGQWGPIPGNMCHGTAAGGAILVEPQLRGSQDQGQNALLGPIDFRSEGRVEFCAGEVDDSLSLMQIAQRRCDANPTQVGMWGESHGACITLQAASRKPEGLLAAATLVAPIDLVTGYEFNAARVPGGTIPAAPGCDPLGDHQLISAGFAAMFGTPDTAPDAYAARSAIHDVAALADVPLLMVFGREDCLIDVTTQACPFRDALVGAGANVIAYHLDGAAQVTTEELPGCTPMGFQATWPPPADGFAGSHYLIVGDGQGHQLAGPARAREFEAIRTFLLAHATGP